MVLISLTAGTLYCMRVDDPIPAPVYAKPLSTQEINRSYDIRKAQLAAEKVFRRNGFNPWLSERVARYSLAAHLSPRLVAADVIVESGCNPNAVSPHGAIGVMQVMPKIWKVPVEVLVDPDENLKIGTRILANYVQSYGVRGGLQHYYGMVDGSEEYADHVLSVAGYESN